MPRPEHKTVTITVDDLEIQATEGQMLVDAAKNGDVEIPYFCYEPKLGNPVGACRMCLVEIEGIPKLQTSCSTAVKDGMVVRTATDRVRTAQNSVVEFLLVNHPLDCPVCDKGGECPLQDITFGWGLGRSRFIEPKRHFQKPLALSPLVAIDRERCILCYRCVRFSQEISEDYQLIFAERGAETYVTTHDGHPYVAPFSGNITELCPVGALTSQPYRFRARPWDIEEAGGICTLCPSQCNVSFTVRDEKVMRVMARDNEAVDDGWLCDKGRYAYQAIHVDERITRPMVREGTELRPVSWDRALSAAAGIARSPGRVAALAGGQATNEEGFLLQRIVRDVLGSGDIDVVSARPAPIALSTARALNHPRLQATVPDIEFADTVVVIGCEPLDESPIWDLRIRKGVRRRGVKLVVASARPSALDANARQVVRYLPGTESTLLAGAARWLAGSEDDVSDEAAVLGELLRAGGEDVVMIYPDRLDDDACTSLLRIAEKLGLADRDGAGLLQLPSGANHRGLREVGVSPIAGPGYSEPAVAGRGAVAMGTAGAAGELGALLLLQADPLRDLPNREVWEQALARTPLVVAFASVLTEGLAEHADVIFPSESHAEKEGTVTHPDGRVQRLRVAIRHPGEIRPNWSTLAELATMCGAEGRYFTSGMVFKELIRSLPFLEGLTLDEIGGRGVRWPERAQASMMPAGTVPPDGPDRAPDVSGGGDGKLRFGTYRSVWASPEVEISPALAFTVARQAVELSPQDAKRLGIGFGSDVVVSSNGTRLYGTAVVRTGIPEGTVFLADGLAANSANELHEPAVEVRPA